MGAIGINHYAELLNGVYTIYNKSNGSIAGSRTTDTQFWIDSFTNAGTPFNPGIDISDPRIMFDPASKRWFACEVTTLSPGPSSISTSSMTPRSRIRSTSSTLVRLSRPTARSDDQSRAVSESLHRQVELLDQPGREL